MYKGYTYTMYCMYMYATHIRMYSSTAARQINSCGKRQHIVCEFLVIVYICCIVHSTDKGSFYKS